MFFDAIIVAFVVTRPKPADGRQGLDWIVGPKYSIRVKMKNKPATKKKTIKTDLEP